MSFHVHNRFSLVILSLEIKYKPPFITRLLLGYKNKHFMNNLQEQYLLKSQIFIVFLLVAIMPSSAWLQMMMMKNLKFLSSYVKYWKMNSENVIFFSPLNGRYYMENKNLKNVFQFKSMLPFNYVRKYFPLKKPPSPHLG